MRFEELWMGWLVCLALLVGVLFYVWVLKTRRQRLRLWGDTALVRYLACYVNESRYFLKLTLMLVTIVVILIALMRPQLGERAVNSKRKGVDIIVAIDTSLSMLAEDVKPNRLEKAKREVTLLIENVKGDRLGLVAFAGRAFVQCPLTIDRAITKMLLSLIDAQTISLQGTSLADAIRVSRKAFDEGETQYKTLILITDGEDHEGEALRQAELAKKEGVRIYTVGIGRLKGAPIPLLDEYGKVIGYKKDSSQKVVMSRVNESILKRIAQITQGAYIHGLQGGWNLKSIYESIANLDKKEMDSKLLVVHEDRYQYVLWLVFCLLLIETLLRVRSREE